MAAKTFGEFLKQRRIASGQTLRAFCAVHGFDVGNFSKMEARCPCSPSRGRQAQCLCRSTRAGT